MSEYLRRFLRDYPGIADNPHIYTVDTDYGPAEEVKNYRGEVIRTVGGSATSTIKIWRVEIKEEVKAEIILPMSEVGLFLYGLELHKEGVRK